MRITNIHEAKTHLSRLIERVQAGEEIIIGKAGKPVAKLVPYEGTEQLRKPGLWRGKVRIAEDFDELPEEFLAFFGEADAYQYRARSVGRITTDAPSRPL